MTSPDDGTAAPGRSRRKLSGAERFARAFDDKSAGLDRFGLVLVLTVASVIGLALVDITGGDQHDYTQDVGAVAAAVLVGLTLITALRASGLSKRRQRFIDVLVILVVVSYVVSLFGTRTDPGKAAPGVSMILVTLSLAAPVVIVLRLARHRGVTLQTIMGAISAYLLIAVAYYYFFLSVDQSQQGFFSGSVRQPSSTFMYFSLTTITTVGYGDFTAASRLGRLLATSEAVIGQVYLVTFVAFIVSLGASAWKRHLEAIDDVDESESDGTEA
jgi:hypothetical protein